MAMSMCSCALGNILRMVKYGIRTRVSSWPGREAAGRSITPTIWNSWPSTSIHLPIGSSSGSSCFWTSSPITTTGM